MEFFHGIFIPILLEHLIYVSQMSPIEVQFKQNVNFHPKVRIIKIWIQHTACLFYLIGHMKMENSHIKYWLYQIQFSYKQNVLEIYMYSNLQSVISQSVQKLHV